jgi:Uma2 family endonuclease
MSESVIASPIIEYPESDGKPVGETDVHRREILHTIETLERHFRNVPDIYVSGNLMFYYEEGNPAAVVSPDVFVVKGVRKGLRRTYKLWEEGVAPCVVIEMTSRSTRLEDKGNKRALYALLGVREYFLFDPLGEYLKPPLQGFTLVDGEYAALPVESDGGIISRELGLKLYRDETVLRLFDLASGREVVRTEDLSDVLQQALSIVQQAEEHARLAAEHARLAAAQAQQEADARRRAEEQARLAAAQAQQEADARRRAEEQARLAAAQAQQEADARRRAEEQAQREADARRRAEEQARLAAEQAQREADARRRAEEQAQREADARRRAEAEIERLRAEFQRLRGDV